MPTDTNTQYMKSASQRAQADIASLADWIECELDKFDDDSTLTWATIGSLEYVRQQLMDALEHVSSVPRSEIQRSLDELHM